MARIQTIAKLTYQGGMVMGVVAVLYRLLTIGAFGESIVRATTIAPGMRCSSACCCC